MPHPVSRRGFLIGAAGAAAALAIGAQQAPAQKKAANLRMWILKTYVEPTNKAIEASAARWAQKNGGSVTVEYFTFEDMQTKYVAAIENKSTPDVGQLETGAPARFAGMGGTPLPGSPSDFGKLIADETEKWGKVIRTANIKPA